MSSTAVRSGAGGRIRQLRRRWGYTQEALAGELNSALGTGYNKSAVSKWETGATRAPEDVLEELERLFGVRDGFLLESSGNLDAAVRTGSPTALGHYAFQVGRMKLSVVRIQGGNGTIRYTHPGGIQTTYHNRRSIPPEDIAQHYHWLLDLRKKESQGAAFEQREMLRLDDYEVALSDPDDEPYPLKLHVSPTDYYTMMATNRSLDAKLPGSALTLRDIYAKDPTDFSGSELSNPLCVNLSLVTTRDWKIYVARRGDKVATNPNNLGPPISGTANPLFDCDGPGRYNPFLTGQRESFEEVTEPYRPELSEITIFGLARTLMFYLPFLFGELRLDMDESDIRSFTPRDNWDTRELISIPFTPEDVIGFIKRTYRYMTENQDFYPATTLFGLYQSLLYQYPNRWRDLKEALQNI